MTDAPLLSLIIPTKNRKVYLLNLLGEIVRQQDSQSLGNVEVIVHDNSDELGLEAELAALGADYIRYFHTADRIGVHENFERAVAKARGDYLCAIGDDDGIILPAALPLLAEAKAKGIEAVQSERIFYSWPGVRHRLWGDSGGRAVYEHLYAGLKDHVRDPAQSIDEVFASGSLEGLGRLPRVYHGYVARAAMDRLREKCGSCFPGGSPDMANAAALAGIVDKLWISRTVTHITGHSKGSGGGEGAAGIHHAELEDAVLLHPESRENWTPGIPRYWSGMTVYAQAAVEGARAGAARVSVPFNFRRLCAACLVYQAKSYRGHALRADALVHGTSVSARIRLYALAAWLFLCRLGGLVRTAYVQLTARHVIGHYSSMADLLAALAGEKHASHK